MKTRMLCLASGAIGSVIAFFLLFLFITPKLSIHAVEAACEGDCAGADTIRVAMQLGRLDIISLTLTFLGILIAVLSIFGFVAVREKAVLQARDVATDWMNKNGAALLAQEYSKLDDTYDEDMTDENATNIMSTFSGSSDKKEGEE